MSVHLSAFRVDKRGPIDVRERPTEVDPAYCSKADYQSRLRRGVARLSELQERLYADGRTAVLVLFQAMDAAGKDGAIKHVLSGVNPQGCEVFSFKHPGPEELRHDFMWRYYRNAPERGRIGIFNRSYYEEVLIARVHPEIITGEEMGDADKPRDAVIKERYRSIRHFERHLTENGVAIVKIFLHISKEEQRKRFLSRLDDPEKTWKFSLNDMTERRFWDDYMEAYSLAISATASRRAPWHIVPADDKKTARLIVSEVLVEAMSGLELSTSRLEADPAKLAAWRRELQSETPG